jgi:hypothetical protein
VRPTGEEFALELFGSGDQSSDDFDDEDPPLPRDVETEKSHIQGYLVVSAPPGMDFGSHISNQLNESMFNVHMDVFQFVSKRKASCLNFPPNLMETVKDGLCVLVGDDVLPG